MKVKSYDDADVALLEIGKLDVEIAGAEALMNKEIQDIRNKYDKDTTEARIKKKELEENVEDFCRNNEDDFKKERSKILTHGSIGFAFNPPKVMQYSKKWKVAESIKFINKLLKGVYIRVINKEEIDKDAILRDYGRKDAAGKIILNAEKLAKVGLRIEQDERFEININWESLPEKAA